MNTANKIKLVSDRVGRAKALLLSQFKESPNINKMLEVFIDEVQELENTIIDLQEKNTLRGSNTYWLDIIGESLGVRRGLYNDNDYKNAIKIAMFKKQSTGTRDDILRITTALSNDPFVKVENNYPHLIELIGFLNCITESESGVQMLSELFPLGSAIKIVERKGKPFAFNTGNQGFGSGAKLSNLAYHDYGIINNPKFITFEQALPPQPTEFPPNNLVPPALSGDDFLGGTLTVNAGGWSGTEPITFTYQWLRNNEPIDSETESTYVITESDLGQSISCRVTASNAVGTSIANSNFIAISEDTPPATFLTDDLGLADIYSFNTLTAPKDFKTVSSSFVVLNDGTITRTTNTPAGSVINNDQWLVTTGVGLGSDYTISYIIVNGDTPSGLAPNTTAVLDSNRVIAVTISGEFPTITSTTINVTIRKISDPSVVKSRTITLSAELVDAYN